MLEEEWRLTGIEEGAEEEESYSRSSLIVLHRLLVEVGNGTGAEACLW